MATSEIDPVHPPTRTEPEAAPEGATSSLNPNDPNHLYAQRTATPEEHRFSSMIDLATKLAAEVADRLGEGIRARGEASLAVSGGRTPELFFSKLSYSSLDWSKVTVTLVDERWVEPSSSQSNEHLVRKRLLRAHAAAARFVPLKNAHPTPKDGRAACEAALAQVPRPFDAVVLGMGADGHTASLFSGDPALADALDPEGTSRVRPALAPSAPHQRMTLTLPALLCSRWIALAISGSTKWGVYELARRPGPVLALPVRAVLHQAQTPVDVFWAF